MVGSYGRENMKLEFLFGFNATVRCRDLSDNMRLNEKRRRRVIARREMQTRARATQRQLIRPGNRCLDSFHRSHTCCSSRFKAVERTIRAQLLPAVALLGYRSFRSACSVLLICYIASSAGDRLAPVYFSRGAHVLRYVYRTVSICEFGFSIRRSTQRDVHALFCNVELIDRIDCRCSS